MLIGFMDPDGQLISIADLKQNLEGFDLLDWSEQSKNFANDLCN
jgi:hypothetical protein